MARTENILMNDTKTVAGLLVRGGRVLLGLRARWKQVRVTLAVVAGVTPKLLEMSDMVKVLEDWEAAL